MAGVWLQPDVAVETMGTDKPKVKIMPAVYEGRPVRNQAAMTPLQRLQIAIHQGDTQAVCRLLDKAHVCCPSNRSP